MKTIDYYFTLVSPWTYIGDPILRAHAEKHGAAIRHIPVNLGAVFEATGGIPLPQRSEARKALRMQELKRWRAFRNTDLNLEPKFFPNKDKAAAAVVIAAQRAGHPVGELVYGFLKGVWADERDIADPDIIATIADEAGLDGKALLSAIDDPDVEAEWNANTETAIGLGVMGSPFYIIGEQKLWGQDRLEHVDLVLGGELAI